MWLCNAQCQSHFLPLCQRLHHQVPLPHAFCYPHPQPLAGRVHLPLHHHHPQHLTLHHPVRLCNSHCQCPQLSVREPLPVKVPHTLAERLPHIHHVPVLLPVPLLIHLALPLCLHHGLQICNFHTHGHLKSWHLHCDSVAEPLPYALPLRKPVPQHLLHPNRLPILHTLALPLYLCLTPLLRHRH